MDCTERCQRLHPQCTLKLARSIAPDHLWHWSVTLPNGHIWALKGGMPYDQALESMRTEGAIELLAADARWREANPPPNTRS